MQTYKTFKRSCTDWKSFSSARKITYETRLSYDQAREMCDQFNSNLSAAQKRKGTKLEFTAE